MYTTRTHKTMSNSEIISFRLNADQIAALEALGEPGETKQATAKRIVLAAIGGTPQVSPVPQDVLDKLRGEFIDRMNTQSGSINEVLAKQWDAIKALREELKALQLVGIQSVHSSKPTEETSLQEEHQERIQAVYNCVQDEEVTQQEEPQEVITPGEDLSDGNQGGKEEYPQDLHDQFMGMIQKIKNVQSLNAFAYQNGLPKSEKYLDIIEGIENDLRSRHRTQEQFLYLIKSFANTKAYQSYLKKSK